METEHLIGISSSTILALAGTFFNESIKELIKKFFSIRTKKQVTKMYWLVFLIAVLAPLFIAYLAQSNKTRTREVIVPTNKIEPIQMP